MDWRRRWKLMWRWSLVSATAIALFWTTWYLFAGSVPAVEGVKIASKWTIILPFRISRFWDVLVGPIWSCIIILVFTNKKITEDKNLVAGLIAGLGAGLVAGLIAGLGVGLVAGLGAGLVAELVAGLVAGLGVGLGAGLGAGLVAGLVAGLGVGLVAGLGVLIKLIASEKFWKKIDDWILTR